MVSADASCPLSYRYAPSTFRQQAVEAADTVYVIGGLYGNLPALHELVRMQYAEARSGHPVSLVFNGDFHWLDNDRRSFLEINEFALAALSTRGNVETEIAMPGDLGCGCGYPSYVEAGLVQRSADIMRALQHMSGDLAVARSALAALPMTRTVAVGGVRIAILHGDPVSLSGWRFAAERLKEGLRGSDEASGRLATPAARVESYFREADVRIFACTHTCLPFARVYRVDGVPCCIVNNGSAGMANFRGSACGVVTRISADSRVPPDSLYGVSLGPVRIDALPVRFDMAAWLERFRANWPIGSPADVSYTERIRSGPDFAIADAIGPGIERYA